jgi:hypothetical protein
MCTETDECSNFNRHSTGMWMGLKSIQTFSMERHILHACRSLCFTVLSCSYIFNHMNKRYTRQVMKAQGIIKLLIKYQHHQTSSVLMLYLNTDTCILSQQVNMYKEIIHWRVKFINIFKCDKAWYFMWNLIPPYDVIGKQSHAALLNTKCHLIRS